MTDRIVDQVKSRLTVKVHTDRGGGSSLAFHLRLELSKKNCLVPSHGKRHVFTFAGAEASIATSFEIGFTTRRKWYS